ncbi:MAG: helix-turn-helix domain-containing protein [Planctomycetota bacterium]
MAVAVSGENAIRRLATKEQVSEHFGVTGRTINIWIARGLFPAPRRIGRRERRWDVAELNDWIEAGCPAVNEGSK